MPRYYCDYCDTYLTHDSPSVRKQHNAGYKHKANIRSYYQKFEEQQTQILIDQKIKEHLGQTGGYHQIGAAYNQHLAAFPAGRPRLPVLPPPFGVPGSIPPHMLPGMRPPILPLPVPGHPGPVPGHPGYGNSQMIPMQPMHASSMPQQNSGALPPPPPPPSTGIPSPVPGGGQPPSSSGTQLYNVNPPGTPASTAIAGGFSYPQSSQTGH